jgi:hypothetical protein
MYKIGSYKDCKLVGYIKKMGEIFWEVIDG